MDDFRQIRERLLAKMAELERRLGRITSDIRRREGPLAPDFEDQAVERENDQVLDRLDEAGRREIEMMRAALTRMEAGTYGACVACAGRVPLRRLEALPYTLRCVQCAASAEST